MFTVFCATLGNEYIRSSMPTQMSYIDLLSISFINSSRRLSSLSDKALKINGNINYSNEELNVDLGNTFKQVFRVYN